MAEKNCAKAALEHCKDPCLALDAELHVLKSDDLTTNDGQHYTEEVQKTDNYFTSVHLVEDLQPYYPSERYKSKRVLYKWTCLMES